jgi:putative transposase
VRDLPDGRFKFLELDAASGYAVKPYPLAEDRLEPVLRVAVPQAPRLVAPGGTVHVVARCNNREFYFGTPEDFEVLVAHLQEMVRTYEVTLYAYTLMSNHAHLLLQAPKLDTLVRPLRWVMTERAKAFHRVRGHVWERPYRACLVKERARR